MLRFSPGVVGGGLEHLLGAEARVGIFTEWADPAGWVAHGWDARDPWRSAARAVEAARRRLKRERLMNIPQEEKVLNFRGKCVILRSRE